MIVGQVFLTGAAEQKNFTVDLGRVTFMGETSVTVLVVIRGEHHIVGQLDECLIVAAGRADKTIGDAG